MRNNNFTLQRSNHAGYLKSIAFQGGFTLVELLLTVGIVGVLVSIAIPQYQEYRKQAYDAAALSVFHGLHTAAIVIVNEQNELTAADSFSNYGFVRKSGLAPVETRFGDYIAAGPGILDLFPGVVDNPALSVSVGISTSVGAGRAPFESADNLNISVIDCRANNYYYLADVDVADNAGDMNTGILTVDMLLNPIIHFTQCNQSGY